MTKCFYLALLPRQRHNLSTESLQGHEAHQGGHRSEVKSSLAEHLLENVDSIPVLSVPGILLKLLHMFQVLQRQADLRR